MPTGMNGGQGFGRVSLFTDYLGAAIDPAWAGVSENSGTGVILVGQANGVATLVTGTTSGNRSMNNAGLNFKASTGKLVYEARVTLHTAITLRAAFIGLTDTVAIENPIELGAGTVQTSTATDAVGFFYDTDADTDKWYFAGVKADVDTALMPLNVNGAQAVPVADVWATFRIEVDLDGNAVFSYGEDKAGQWGCREVGRLNNCVTPTVLLTPVVMTETRTTAASTVYVDYQYIEGGRVVRS